jgi:hypothetical protein
MPNCHDGKDSCSPLLGRIGTATTTLNFKQAQSVACLLRNVMAFDCEQQQTLFHGVDREEQIIQHTALMAAALRHAASAQ